MFLFDKQKTGRLHLNSSCFENFPSIVWEIELPSRKKYAAESTPIEDEEGNLYFGTHGGVVYSISPIAGVLWSYYTGKRKVYSSATWVDRTKFVIASGDGELFCFNKNGNVLWVYDICGSYREKSLYRRYLQILTQLPFLYDFSMKKLQLTKCWSSPNICGNYVFITGFGDGLHAVNSCNGKLEWKLNLGWPNYHRAGVALTSTDLILAVSQHQRVTCATENGDVLWSKNIGPIGFESWSNPSIDEDLNQVYVVWSFSNLRAIIRAIDITSGYTKWTCSIPAGIRGTPTIGRENYIYLPTLNGSIYKINRHTGDIASARQVASRNLGLWTSAAVLLDDSLLLTTKTSASNGTLMHLNKDLNPFWEIEIGKALSVPLVNRKNEIVVGSWHGKLYGLK